MKSMKTCPSVQVNSHLTTDAMLRQEESKEERGRSDVSPSSSDVEEENESVPAAISSSTANCDVAKVKVTVYRRLTFRRGEDFDSLQAGIEFSAPKSHAIQVLKGELESLRRVLEEEKRDTIARTEPTSQHDTTASAPTQNAQKPETVDPYVSLPWRASKNDANLGMVRVNSNLTSLARQLYEKLKAAQNRALRIGDCCYKLWVTNDGAEFLQKWSKQRGGS
jgi:hypothetical protein